MPKPMPSCKQPSSVKNFIHINLTATGKAGALEEEPPKVGPEGAKRAGAIESKVTDLRERKGFVKKSMPKSSCIDCLDFELRQT